MPRYSVTVQTIIMEYYTVEGEAEDQAAAEDMAIASADLLANVNGADGETIIVGAVVHSTEEV